MTVPHSDRPPDDRRRLAVALAIAAGTALLEVVGGLVTGSVALIADASHVGADMAALVMALVAVWMSGRPHNLRWTFGFHRAEVLAATLNGFGLLLLSAVLVREAVRRIVDPAPVDAGGLLAVALAGLVANAVQLRVLRHSHSVNARAARLHVLSDLGGSVAAVLAGVVVQITGQPRADPILSLVIVMLVALGAVRLLLETTDILMAKAPAGVSLPDIERALAALPGVRAAHDMHAWTITSGFVAFVCHLQIEPGADGTEVVASAVALLRDRFGIEHVTIQPEAPPLYDLDAGSTASGDHQ